ncbi:MAG: LamG-like jellyroll fold domain-containing protein [Planctomycetota bacterium]
MKVKTILVEILIVLVLCGLASAEWTEPVPVTEVNTELAEWTPFLSFDGLSLYFARVRTDTFCCAQIFEATRQEPYGPFTSVNEVLSSSGKRVFAPWVSQDNLRMYYFEQTQIPTLWELKFSERASVNAPWPQGTDILELNQLGKPYAPKLTADELNIFFCSSVIPGGKGGYDIWMASRPDMNSPFDVVTNLAEINTTANEVCPSISPDGLTLYFQSNYNGSHQLFRATRASLSEPFGNIEHLSIFDIPGYTNHMPCISSDGSTLYFIRQFGDDRSTGDIYVSYWIVDPYDDAVTAILDAIAEKLDALDKVNAALEKEWAAYEALQELLESGDYGDLSKGDIVTAMQKIHSSIQHEEQSMDALGKSIEKLQDALAGLGCELPPPVSHWKFDEGSGTTAYDSVGTNDGTVFGATWTTGQVDSALSFDGVDDYVDIPYDASLDINASQGISVSVWFKLNSYPAGWNQGPIFGLFDSTDESVKNYLFIDKPLYGNLITWDQYPPSWGFIKSIKPDLDTWYHVAVVEDSSYRAIYINGSLDVSDNISESYQGNPPDTIRIGSRAGLAPFYFDGSIDDVIIYDQVLSDQQIQQLYKYALAGL